MKFECHGISRRWQAAQWTDLSFNLSDRFSSWPPRSLKSKSHVSEDDRNSQLPSHVEIISATLTYSSSIISRTWSLPDPPQKHHRNMISQHWKLHDFINQTPRFDSHWDSPDFFLVLVSLISKVSNSDDDHDDGGHKEPWIWLPFIPNLQSRGCWPLWRTDKSTKL